MYLYIEFFVFRIYRVFCFAYQAVCFLFCTQHNVIRVMIVVFFCCISVHDVVSNVVLLYVSRFQFSCFVHRLLMLNVSICVTEGCFMYLLLR